MLTLPDDVLLVIFSHTHIDTFLALRLLNHSTHSLINTHMRGLTEAVARSTFPAQDRILRNLQDLQSANPLECLQLLKGLRYHQLAAIMLECRETDPISAEDPLGNVLRGQLAQAWQVLQRFAAIAREVESIYSGETHEREVPGTGEISTDPLSVRDLACLREVEICSRRMAHLDTLPLPVFKAYQTLRFDLRYSVLDKLIQLPTDADEDICKVIDDPIVGP